MHAWRGLFVAWLWLAGAAPLAAADLQPVPALHARVTDLTGTLDAARTQALEQRLAELERAKGAQLAVLIVPTTQPEDIAQYGIRVGDAWRLGRKEVDDGVILIVAKNDRRVRIEVGTGLEGAIPDAAAARIIREYITPRFRDGDYAGGIDAAVGALTLLVNGEALPAPLIDEDAPAGGDIDLAWIVAFFAATFLTTLTSSLPKWLGAPLVGAGVGVAVWYATGVLVTAVVLGVLGVLFMVLVTSSGSGRFASGGGSGGFGG
ncbi:MAG: YgcG family protein, partial [Dokdonella sp.]